MELRAILSLSFIHIRIDSVVLKFRLCCFAPSLTFAVMTEPYERESTVMLVKAFRPERCGAAFPKKRFKIGYPESEKVVEGHPAAQKL